MITFNHQPVLLAECMDALNINPKGTYVDCTLGGAGHSSEILKNLDEDGLLIAFDKDPQACEVATQRLHDLGAKARFIVLSTDFSNIKSALHEIGVHKVDGILADLGVSSFQLDTPSRGFSFRFDAPLDMRMNPLTGRTAEQLVNEERVERLTEIFFKYGEEKYSTSIARNICKMREQKRISTTTQLVDIIMSSIPAKARREKQHPAKRVFQALRIEVNGELAALEALLDEAIDLLHKGGRLAIITFHSLEDRCVKQTFREWQNPCTCPANLPCICGKKPLGIMKPHQGYVASEQEIAVNPRSRSARVRVFIKESENT